ncbi:hypothetical protein AVEN_262161-1 [Araneus ventricosus]|uniref:Uncharacterized protein n=1 Tax=Araneus ventricosus TaxID=182803 RepID=A0A4Y2EGZ4_ARAVE|nr:hypothetical protein AVEN_262161-1 [Araneus ventricosus]
MNEVVATDQKLRVESKFVSRLPTTYKFGRIAQNQLSRKNDENQRGGEITEPSTCSKSYLAVIKAEMRPVYIRWGEVVRLSHERKPQYSGFRFERGGGCAQT